MSDELPEWDDRQASFEAAAKDASLSAEVRAVVAKLLATQERLGSGVPADGFKDESEMSEALAPIEEAETKAYFALDALRQGRLPDAKVIAIFESACASYVRNVN